MKNVIEIDAPPRTIRAPMAKLNDEEKKRENIDD